MKPQTHPTVELYDGIFGSLQSMEKSIECYFGYGIIN